jgi:signal transduction histidine kinase
MRQPPRPIRHGALQIAVGVLVFGLALFLFVMSNRTGQDRFYATEAMLDGIWTTNLQLDGTLFPLLFEVRTDVDAVTVAKQDLIRRTAQYAAYVGGTESAELQTLVGRKLALVEDFKSQQAVARNSRAIASEMLATLWLRSEALPSAAQRDLSDIERSFLGFVSRRDPPSAVALRELIAAQANAGPEWTTFREWATFTAHAETLMRFTDLLSGIMIMVYTLPFEDLRRQLHNASRFEHERTLAIASRYRAALLAVAVILLGFSGFKVWEVSRYVRLIRRANDELEHRVEERTRELQEEITEREHAQTELEKTHLRLIDASRQAGMAEVATNVLHNVGNVLNSVNVTASVIAEKTEQSRIVTLPRLAMMLREHEADLGHFLATDPRGKEIPQYLGKLAEHLLAERNKTLQDLESLRKNIDHIKSIVAMQQSHSKVAGVKASTNVIELAEDALRINATSLQRHNIEIVRDYADVPTINTEPHKILQVVVNLVRNAKDACEASARTDKRITLRVAKGDGRINVSVIDNGIGIAAENMTRVFAHGFTTKTDGHGFGLHSGALAARDLGGSLKVQSDGVDRGASFTLELPMDEIKRAAEG